MDATVTKPGQEMTARTNSARSCGCAQSQSKVPVQALEDELSAELNLSIVKIG